MDLIDDFFDKDKSLAHIKLPGAAIGGELKIECDINEEYREPIIDDSGPDYSSLYREQEELLCIQYANQAKENEILRPDSPSTLNTEFPNVNIDLEMSESLYSKMNFAKKLKNDLPICNYQEKITETIAANSVVVIQGPTGCGKTTQVPQYILDDCQAQNKYCKIAITQPRRIAATSVAKRVAEERDWNLGSVVGYQVGLDNKTYEDTLLTYMTTGVLLQKIIQKKSLNHFTHIIIDEIHERDADLDFLLLVVRKFVRTVSRHVKVILMSATFDVDHFSHYFMVPSGKTLVPAPVIDITKNRPYAINIYHFNDFKILLRGRPMPEFNPDEPMLHSVLNHVVLELLKTFDEMEVQSDRKLGSVLIFLPGLYEIEELFDYLVEHMKTREKKWFIVPLHSSITIEEQRRAFESAPENQRKIIISTNIAESSITVPDVIYVIDYCLTKILICDPSTNYSSLKLVWASHTNCEQRSGRVGRLASGRVYRLVTEQFYHEAMQRDIQPEMLRSPLHRLILLAKMLDLGMPPHAILALAINRPALDNITQTIALLKEAGALSIATKGQIDPRDGDLTYIGRVMSILPLDINVSKLIILGYMFSTLKECIIMAAATSLQNIFSNPFHDRMNAYHSKISWADCSSSDLIAYLHVYIVWERNKHSNAFRMKNAESNWMKRNFLQPKVMREWQILVNDIKNRLNRMGIIEPIQGRVGNLTEHEKAMMLKVVISGAFYPNYFVRSSEGGQVDESDAVRVLGGRDPYTTVYLTGKPDQQPIEPYTKAIRDLMKECGHHLQISYDKSSKIFVQFKHDMIPSGNNAMMPGKITMEVYNAIKFRNNKTPIIIDCLSPEEAQRRVKYWEKQQLEMKKPNSEEKISVIPSLKTLAIEIRISYINNPGYFFAHNVENMEIMQTLNVIERNLNTDQLSAIGEDVIIGKTYAAPYDNKYYRARVVCSAENNGVQVIFIDYGNIECVQRSTLMRLPFDLQKIPPLAIECVLTNIQPSHEQNIHALWTKEAIEEFSRRTLGFNLYAKVYSVVDNIVSVELFKKTPNYAGQKSINSWLIENKYAQPAIESFLSQDNNKKRQYAQSHQSDGQVYNSNFDWYNETNEMPQVKRDECHFTMRLQGPYSPLEMKVFSVLQCSLNKTIGVEWNSVNSVLLDSDPQDPHDRLLVAATIGQSIDGNKLTLRHTTVMPAIHGFPVLMALIFSPKMSLHTDKEGTRLTSILCGLGSDPETKAAIFPSHDLALNLDFVLTEDDITRINEIRYFMNNAVVAMNTSSSPLLHNNDQNHEQPVITIENCQNEIRKCIRQLLRIPYANLDRKVLPNIYKWDNLPKDVPVTTVSFSREGDIWAMHSFVKLIDNEEKRDIEIRQHLEELKDYANNTIPMNEITCKLCNVATYSTFEMRTHLLSQIHKNNLTELEDN